MNSTQIIDDNYLNTLYNKFLAPIINNLYKEFNNYFDSYEDDIFKSIYPHEGTQIHFQLFKLPEVLPFVSYLIPAFDQFLICCSFGWFACLTLKHACGKQKPLEKLKSVCMLRIKIIFSFLLFTLLSFSVVTTYKMAFKLDWAFRNFVRSGCDIINDIHDGNIKFELQLQDVNMSVIKTLEVIENMTNNLSANIYGDMHEIVEKELIDGTKLYSDIMVKSDYMFDRSGLKITRDKIEHNMEKELNITEKLMIMFNNNIKLLISNITEDITFNQTSKQTALRDIQNIKKYADNYRGKYKHTNWNQIYQILQKTYKDILPKINTSIHFINKYPKNIRHYIKPHVNEIKYTAQNFRNETLYIIEKLQNIIARIFHSNATCTAKKIIQYSNYSEYVLNRNTTLGWKDFYFSTVILLVPTFHTFLYLILFVHSFCLATYQVCYAYKRKYYVPYIHTPCFKVISEFGLMLLWTGLLLSILSYLGALALSAVCRPLHTQHMYSHYIDNQHIWGNKTWLDAVIYPWNHNYKTKDILEKCSNNTTVYQAFDAEKYWDVSMMFQNNKLNIDYEDWIKLIKIAVQHVNLPNEQNCLEARYNFNFIEKDLAQLSPHIMNDVELFQNKTFEILLQDITQKFSATSIYEKLSQNLDIFNFIQNQNLEYILNNFMEFKFLLKSIQNYLSNIQTVQDQMVNKIDQNIQSIIQNKVKEMDKSVNGLLRNLERDLSYKIQYEIGNCQFCSTTIKRTQQTICADLPLILNMAWITYNINSLLMLFSIILCRTLSTDVAKIRQDHRRTLKIEAYERAFQQRQRLENFTISRQLESHRQF